MRRTLFLLAAIAMAGCDRSTDQAAAPAAPPSTAPATTRPTTQPVQDWRHGSGICNVHHRKMDTVTVHGLLPVPIDPTPEYIKAREKHFPNCGIEYGPELYSKELGMIYVCPDCEAARRAWRR